MAIAKNYRKHPEALLYQLELALGDVRDTFEWIRKNAPASWSILRRRFIEAKADVRGLVKVPEWVKVATRKAKALAQAIKGACMQLVFNFDQVETQVAPAAPAPVQTKPAKQLPALRPAYDLGPWLRTFNGEYRIWCSENDWYNIGNRITDEGAYAYRPN